MNSEFLKGLVYQDLDKLSGLLKRMFIHDAIFALLGEYDSFAIPKHKLRIERQHITGYDLLETIDGSIITVYWDGNTLTEPCACHERPFLDVLQAALRDRIQDPSRNPPATPLSLYDPPETWQQLIDCIEDIKHQLKSMSQRLDTFEYKLTKPPANLTAAQYHPF